jgi:large subunit ribosomal protein L6
MAAVTHKQSRVGKRPVTIPAGVKVTITGSEVKAKGPMGETSLTLRPEVTVKQKGSEILVGPAPGSAKNDIRYQGLGRSLIHNMLEGVSTGFKKSLDFRGVGYRAEAKDGVLTCTVGLSHQVKLQIPSVVKVKIETIDAAGIKYPRVHLESFDKQLVGQFAARIRSARPPEPYKGKGVRYTGERIREKAGKAGKAK